MQFTCFATYCSILFKRDDKADCGGDHVKLCQYAVQLCTNHASNCLSPLERLETATGAGQQEFCSPPKKSVSNLDLIYLAGEHGGRTTQKEWWFITEH